MKVNEIITKKFIDALSDGVVPWKKPWSTAEMWPRNISGRRYSGVNTLMLSQMVTGYECPVWATFNQIKSAKGSINSGEKSSIAVFTKTYKKEVDGEEENRYVLRYYRVWNLQQTTLEWTPPKEREFSKIDCAESLWENMPERPKLIFGAFAASYSPRTDTIKLPRRTAFSSEAHYYATLFHEVVHSTSHETRLARDVGSHQFGSRDYSLEELVAEIGAAFLCSDCEIFDEVEKNSVAYVQSWAKRLEKNPQMIITAASAAQRAYDYVKGEYGEKI